jgi:hypothetical protein
MPSSHGPTHLSLLYSEVLVGGGGGGEGTYQISMFCVYYVLYMRLLISKLFPKRRAIWVGLRLDNFEAGNIHYLGYCKGWALVMDILPASKIITYRAIKQQVH